jgi:diguanylate cyclase (GGDEF)-like protein
MTNYYLPYIFAEFYCILYTITIYSYLNNNIGSEHEVLQLKKMVISYLVMLITDIIWAMNEDNLIYLNHNLNLIVNGLTVVSISFGCYYWYKYVDARLKPSYANNKKYDFLIKIPIVFIVILDIISLKTGLLFYLEDNHYTVSNLFFIQGIVNYFYLLIPTINAIYYAIKTKSSQAKREYLTYTIYMIAPLISGLVEDDIPTVPILALNIFLVIHILFLTIQDLKIYNDALTDLNNRRRLNQYLESAITKASINHSLTLFMMDINKFKLINDIYGHIEGDNALKAFADTLKLVAFKYNAFIARYGGDEFCLVMESTIANPQVVIKDIDKIMEEHQPNIKKYYISVSIGYTICDGTELNISKLIAKADDMLYLNKNKWHEKNK